MISNLVYILLDSNQMVSNMIYMLTNSIKQMSAWAEFGIFLFGFYSLKKSLPQKICVLLKFISCIIFKLSLFRERVECLKL